MDGVFSAITNMLTLLNSGIYPNIVHPRLLIIGSLIELYQVLSRYDNLDGDTVIRNIFPIVLSSAWWGDGMETCTAFFLKLA